MNPTTTSPRPRAKSGSSQRSPIVVVIGHPRLAANVDVESWFRPGDGFLLVRPSEGRPWVSTPHEYFPTVILADELVFTDVSAAGLRSAGPHVRVLILGPAPLDTLKIRELLLKGAMGYLPEDSPPGTIRKAIRSLARNEIWASRAALSQVIMELRKEQIPRLTAREEDVLSGLRRGLSNRLIASELGISHETVRWHLRRIYAKIGVHDRKQTV